MRNPDAACSSAAVSLYRLQVNQKNHDHAQVQARTGFGTHFQRHKRGRLFGYLDVQLREGGGAVTDHLQLSQQRTDEDGGRKQT